MESLIELNKRITKDIAVIVNPSFQVIEKKSWKDVATLLSRNEAYVILPREDNSLIRSAHLEFSWPLVVCQTRYSRPNHSNKKKRELDSPSNKNEILKRDGKVCRYCNGYGDTLDHVVPKSKLIKQGKNPNTWGNLVIACKACNSKKSDKTPEEVGFKSPVITPGYVETSSSSVDGLEELIYTAIMEGSAASM